MKKLTKKALLLINLILAGLLIISSLSVYINPAKAWPFAFIGLAYPFLLLGNIVFLALWVLTRKKYLLISLCVILLTWNQFKKFIQLNPGKDKVPENSKVVKLLSYNVRLFNYYSWLNDKAIPRNILDFIKKESVDIICLQEFMTMDKSYFSSDSIKKALRQTPYSHINYSHTISKNRNLGIATFSSYPIVNKGFVAFEGSPNVSIFSDIDIAGDTVRIYNCHLQSTRLRKDDYHLLDSLFFKYNNQHLDNIRELSFRLRDAYIKRAIQADVLARHIGNSPYPCIVLGDFNDTPVSYTYRKLRGRLKDAYLESGTGIGNTYYGNFPSFRIDYIFSDNQIKTFDFETKRVKWSDHYPITCRMYVE